MAAVLLLRGLLYAIAVPRFGVDEGLSEVRGVVRNASSCPSSPVGCSWTTSQASRQFITPVIVPIIC